MKVEFLYFVCPNWTVADERLAQALTATGRDDITVQRRHVATAEEAERIGFTGSPTVEQFAEVLP